MDFFVEGRVAEAAVAAQLIYGQSGIGLLDEPMICSAGWVGGGHYCKPGYVDLRSRRRRERIGAKGMASTSASTASETNGKFFVEPSSATT